MAPSDAEMKEEHAADIVRFLKNGGRMIDEALAEVVDLVGADTQLHRANMERAEGNQAVADLMAMLGEALTYIATMRYNMAVAGDEFESMVDTFEGSGVLESNKQGYLEDALRRASYASRCAKDAITEIEDGADSITSEAVDMSYKFFTDADVLVDVGHSIRAAEVEGQRALDTYLVLSSLESR